MILKKSKLIQIIVFSLVFLTVELVFDFTISAEENKKNSVYFLNNQGQVNASIFSKDDILYPGKKIVKEFYIANDNNFKCELRTLDINGELRDKNKNLIASTQHEYQEFMNNVDINLYTQDREFFKGTAEEFIKANLLNGNSIFISKNSKLKFIMEINMNMKPDNSTMNMEYIFTLSSNLLGDEIHSDNLVQTGSKFDTGVLIIIGCILFGSGLAICFFHKTNICRIKEKAWSFLKKPTKY